MTAALRGNGLLSSDGLVTGLRTGQLQGFGWVGQVERMWLDYAPDTEGAPRSVIIKRPSSTFTEGMTLAVAEARFYRTRALESADIRGPQIYHCAIGEQPGDCVLVLEDLGDQGFVDQLHGCSPEQAALALTEISRLHGHWWNREFPAALAWLGTPADADGSALCFRWLRAYTGEWPAVLGDIPRLLVRNLDALAARLSRSPCTLVHGDFHCQNMSFDTTGARPTVTFIDFHFVQRGNPMLDVARFLATSITAETRRAAGADLLRSYHDQLLEHGVSGYSAAESADDIRAALLWSLVTPLALYVREIITCGVNREAAFLPYLRQWVAAIEDWDALAVL
ncbi:phosphotransferase [Streptomyces sp. NPDC055189]